jgi:hypothetical protein
LQHPLGVFALNDRVLIADTYNHKIKSLEPRARNVKTFLGLGKPGQADGPTPSFYEPGGLSVAKGKLFVADTNNHAVRVIDLKSKQTSTLRIDGLQPPEVETRTVNGEPGPNADEIKLPAQRVRVQNDGALLIDVELPAGYHLNPSAPQRYRVSIERGEQSLALPADSQPGSQEKVLSRSSKDLKLPLRIPIRILQAGSAEARVQLTLFYCREDNTGTCHIKTLIWRVPVEIVDDSAASNEIKLVSKVTAE